jgi:hypothetical protein
MEHQDIYDYFIYKHQELEKKTLLKKDDIVQFGLINDRLATYSADRSFVITEYYLSFRRLKQLNKEYKRWESRKIMWIRKGIKERKEKLSDYPKWMMDAIISETFNIQQRYWDHKIEDLEVQVDFFKDRAELWKSQIQALQTLSNNIREDKFYFDSSKGGNNVPEGYVPPKVENINMTDSLLRLKKALNNR